MDNVTHEKSRLKCKVYHSTSLCIALCYACIIYVHSTFFGMSRVCIHLDVYEQLVSNGTCCESLDMAYQCVAKKVIKTPTTKKYSIVMASGKQLLANYLLKSPSNDEGYHMGRFVTGVNLKTKCLSNKCQWIF